MPAASYGSHVAASDERQASPPLAGVLGFSLRFVAILGVLSAAVLVDGVLFGGAAAWRLCATTAAVATDILRLFGADAVARGHEIHYRLLICRIIPECTGIDFMGLFVAAVGAFPSARKWKLIGWGLGIPALMAVNLLRVVLLVHIGARWPAAAESGHLHVAPLVILTVTLGMWLLWAERATRVARA